MADTAHLDELTEYRDDEATLRAKVATLATWIRESKRTVAFTGAGISTSANIPDFRGPDGVWTCQAQGREVPVGVEMTQAVPTLCHMMLRQMIQEDKLAFVISQNVDGLHRRSGVPREKLAELHGNLYLEVCWNPECRKEFMRTFDVSARINGTDCQECLKRVPHFCHCTGRSCECGSSLKDSIIHFGENLPGEALRDGLEHSERAELMLVLGSSLRVSPACQMPQDTKRNGGKVVVVNLQTTPCDHMCDLRINGEADTVCALLAQELQMPVTEFDVQRFSRECETAPARSAEPPTVGSALFDTSSWHAVEPLKDCPHTCCVGKDGDLTVDVAAPCCECGSCGENMLCLQCGAVHCGRHVEGHGVKHNQSSGHPMSCGFADLSFWCYDCDAYINESAAALAPVYTALHLSKFDTEPPMIG